MGVVKLLLIILESAMNLIVLISDAPNSEKQIKINFLTFHFSDCVFFFFFLSLNEGAGTTFAGLF